MRRVQGVCSACGRAFAAGEALFSLLRFDGGEFARGDLCGGCFDGRDPAADVFYWRTQYRAAEHGMLRVDFELLLGVVERFAADPRPAARDFAFLLALLLVRHRQLRLVGVVRAEGQERMHLRRPGSQAGFEVEVRELDEARRAELTQVLSGLLDPAQEWDLERWLNPSSTPGS